MKKFVEERLLHRVQSKDASWNVCLECDAEYGPASPGHVSLPRRKCVRQSKLSYAMQCDKLGPWMVSSVCVGLTELRVVGIGCSRLSPVSLASVKGHPSVMKHAQHHIDRS